MCATMIVTIMMTLQASEVVPSVQLKVFQPSPQLPEKCSKQTNCDDEFDNYQGGGILCAAKSVSAFAPAAVELRRKRGKPFTIQVKLFGMTLTVMAMEVLIVLVLNFMKSDQKLF